MQATLERARQSLPGLLGRGGMGGHAHGSEFVPTPNVRNPAMLSEAEAFGQHMATYKAALRRYEHFLGGFLKAIPITARANLPRVWDKVAGGLCEPVRPTVSHQHPNWIGGDFDEHLLRDTRELLDTTLETQVMAPIDRWMESLSVVRGRMKKLDGLRMDLDARRRRMHHKHKGYMKRLERTRGSGGMGGGAGTSGGGGGGGGAGVSGPSATGMSSSSAGGATGGGGGAGVWDELEASGYDVSAGGDEAKAARDCEDMMREAMYLQRKLEAVQASYDEQERLVFEALSGLVRDAAWLKAYVVSSLNTMREALQATAIGLGPCKMPLPGFSTPEGATAAYGQVGDPSPIINSVPEPIMQGAAGLLTHMPTGLREKNLHAHMLTAQPLQTAADKETPRYGPVPPVLKGASHIAAEDVEGIEGPTFAALAKEVHDGAGVGLSTPGTMPHGLLTTPGTA